MERLGRVGDGLDVCMCDLCVRFEMSGECVKLGRRVRRQFFFNRIEKVLRTFGGDKDDITDDE